MPLIYFRIDHEVAAGLPVKDSQGNQVGEVLSCATSKQRGYFEIEAEVDQTTFDLFNPTV